MNGLLRATQAHVEVEQEWISTFKTLSHLHRNLQLVVQVASSDKELILEAIKATIEVRFFLQSCTTFFCVLIP